jgi:hypothetical protein
VIVNVCRKNPRRFVRSRFFDISLFHD